MDYRTTARVTGREGPGDTPGLPWVSLAFLLLLWPLSAAPLWRAPKLLHLHIFPQDPKSRVRAPCLHPLTNLGPGGLTGVSKLGGMQSTALHMQEPLLPRIERAAMLGGQAKDTMSPGSRSWKNSQCDE